MKSLTVIIISLLFWVMPARAQTLYAVDAYGLKGKLISFYTGDEKAGTACAAILRLLRKR